MVSLGVQGVRDVIDRMSWKDHVEALAAEYPGEEADKQRRDVPRILFNLSLALDGLPQGSRIVDIGGGLGLFSVGAAALGMRVTLVDDFQDPGNIAIADSILNIHRRVGVEIDCRDVVHETLGFEPASFDVITTFDSIEHWHGSPKGILHQIIEALKPGGRLVIGVPNCVNLRKRLTVPLGRGKWSPMAEWYEQSTFRGHVREPDVGDLLYIARDLRLTNARILGRNWLGYASPTRPIRIATTLSDRLLQHFPTLCADIYLVGYKP
jgi:2-polyprenyl-3-methyl-5-hydroxy-6-metoxy-1,4-benzoquinol methylase